MFFECKWFKKEPFVLFNLCLFKFDFVFNEFTFIRLQVGKFVFSWGLGE